MVSNTISTLDDVFLIYRVKMDATSGAGTVYHLKAGEFTPVFREVRDAHYPVFYVMFCRIFISFRSLHCLSFRSLHCLSFSFYCFWLSLRYLQTPREPRGIEMGTRASSA
jgi:hypothetical protein